MASCIACGGCILKSNSLYGTEFAYIRKPFNVVLSMEKTGNMKDNQSMRCKSIVFGTSLWEHLEVPCSSSRNTEYETDNKPFFVDYLNAMEAIRVEREKKESRGSSSPRLSNIFLRDTLRRIGLGRKKRRKRKYEVIRQNGMCQDTHQDSNEGSSKEAIDSISTEFCDPNEVGIPISSEVSLENRFPQMNEDEKLSDGQMGHDNLRPDEATGDVKNPQEFMEEKLQNLAKRLDVADLNISRKKFSLMMRRAPITFNDVVVTRLVRILSGLGNWRMVLQVIAWFNSQDDLKSYNARHAYTAALVAFQMARRPGEALAVFYSMLKDRCSYPDRVAYHCIATTLGESGYLNELLDVIDRMRTSPEFGPEVSLKSKRRQLKPERTVYDAVLSACIKQKNCEGAFWVLQQLGHQRQRISSTTYGLVMKVMLACEKYKLVYQVYGKASQEKSLCPLVYEVLINTFWKEGKTDEAVLAVNEMEQLGMVGNAPLYYDFVCCLCSAGRCKEAFLQIKKIRRNTKRSLAAGLSRMVRTCLDSGNIENGVFVFQRMLELSHPDTATCNMMLNAYKDHGMFEDAKALFCSLFDCPMQEDELTPDRFTFDTILNACVAGKLWDDFERFYMSMLNHGYTFDLKRHLCMLLNASWAGKGSLVEMTMEHLTGANRAFPPALLKEHLCLKLAEKDYAAAILYLGGISKDGLAPFSKIAWLNLFRSRALHIPSGKFEDLIRLLEKQTVAVGDGAHDVILGNLLAACKDFVNTRAGVARISLM